MEWEVYGYLRETEDGKVYFRRGIEDVLLFDFNAEVGDTVRGLVVIKIDTVNIYGDVVSKRLHLTPYCLLLE